MAEDTESFLENLPKELRENIKDVCQIVPGALTTFKRLYNYAKDDQDLKRKGKNSQMTSEISDSSIIFQLKEVSVLSPLRKKLDLAICLSSENNKPVLSLSKEKVSELVIPDLNTNVKFAAFLPFPEKKNLVYLLISYHHSLNPKLTEPVLITMNKEGILKQFKALNLLTQSSTEFHQCIEYMRKQAILTGFRISDPFSSTLQDMLSFHVDCHRGTKEGTLYFLPDHILFGFKKPILLFQSQEIESITYSSITRLTFNITLITKSEEKFEFSMIDQNEFAKIDEYVKKKQVKDKSMSDELKAKPMSKGQQQPEEHISALQEAAQQLQEGGGLNNASLGSDDEEADGNFEADSDLSDGSGSESEADDDTDEGKPQDIPLEEEEEEEVEEEEEDGEDNDDDKDEEEVEEIGEESRKNYQFNTLDIPIQSDHDEDGDEEGEEEDEDEDEGSGVEYE